MRCSVILLESNQVSQVLSCTELIYFPLNQNIYAISFSLTGSSLDGFDKNCLMATNLLRRRHGVPDLTWSETLAADARAWARTLAQRNMFEHDYNSMQVKSQGENLAFFKPFKEKCQGPKKDDCVQCREIIEGWYDEVKNYDFGMGKPKTPGGVVMHFTQASTSCLNGNLLLNEIHFPKST